jgi:hypothetical protein
MTSSGLTPITEQEARTETAIGDENPFAAQPANLVDPTVAFRSEDFAFDPPEQAAVQPSAFASTVPALDKLAPEAVANPFETSPPDPVSTRLSRRFLSRRPGTTIRSSHRRPA